MDLIVGMGSRGTRLADEFDKVKADYTTWDLKDGPFMKDGKELNNIFFCLPKLYKRALPLLLKSYKEECKAKRGFSVELIKDFLVARELRGVDNE